MTYVISLMPLLIQFNNENTIRGRKLSSLKALLLLYNSTLFDVLPPELCFFQNKHFFQFFVLKKISNKVYHSPFVAKQILIISRQLGTEDTNNVSFWVYFCPIFAANKSLGVHGLPYPYIIYHSTS